MNYLDPGEKRRHLEKMAGNFPVISCDIYDFLDLVLAKHLLEALLYEVSQGRLGVHATCTMALESNRNLSVLVTHELNVPAIHAEILANLIECLVDLRVH